MSQISTILADTAVEQNEQIHETTEANSETVTYELSATYSAEDNKLRLYPSYRLDTELYQRVKAAGFKWAPKQELFVAPKWTPDREDLCVELAGEISAEESTVAERAEAKAERLDRLASKRDQDAGAYQDASNRISERFVFGQPILVGHHSERRARKDQQRMHNAMRQAIKAQEAANFWRYRAEGVERHANSKSNPRTRLNRIKTLLAELRDWQRRINFAHQSLKLWQDIAALPKDEDKQRLTLHYCGAHHPEGALSPKGPEGESYYDLMSADKVTAQAVIEASIDAHEYGTQNPYLFRWIQHTLNRLNFERAELGPVTRFDGELTPVILQAFTRTHGAEKPRAVHSVEGFNLTSDVALPAHLAEGNSLDISADQWRDLMQSVGYEVPAPVQRRQSTKKQVPLINPSQEQAAALQAVWNRRAVERHGDKYRHREMKTASVYPIGQARFSANSKGSYSPFKTVELDDTGTVVHYNYRGASADPVCRIRVFTGGNDLYAPDAIVQITDKPTKHLPIRIFEETKA